MTVTPSQRWLHRYAVFTACVALLPIVVGALVSTKGAGMAFRDWPTSDGHGMLSYPWLQSAGDKFLEHGHRLAGIAIGLASIGLVALTLRIDRRSWVRWLAVAALSGVIAQGLLGGFRVLMDQQGLAFVHGSFAALVFALLCSFAVVTSARWSETADSPASVPAALGWLALAACSLVFVQYVLGGLVRHRGMALYEHLAFAGIATLAVGALSVAAIRSGSRWLRGPASLLGPLVALQLLLGAGAWITKLGAGAGPWVEWLGFEDMVPVAGSALQVTVRTGHVLGGMLLFATTVVLAARIARLRAVACSSSTISIGHASPKLGHVGNVPHVDPAVVAGGGA